MCAKIDKPAISRSWIKFLLPLLLLWSCREKQAPPKAAIYHWKSSLTLDEGDRKKLDSLGVERLYLRFFDIDRYENKLKPISVLELRSLPPEGMDIVPCVYITNRAISFLPDTAVESLALHVYSKIKKLAQPIKNPISEIQMDCDWTESTAKKYFAFLQTLKTLCEQDRWKLSATIRLHQVKYREKTGIPPVDYGMLMFYNMGDLPSETESNSILNLTTAEKYTGRLGEYPLPLDLALPLFSWGVQFRSGEMEALRSSWNKEEMEKDTLFEKQSGNWYRARENSLFKGQYILKNDRVRIEAVDPELNLLALKFVSSHSKKTPRYLSLFHYNPDEIEQYAAHHIAEIYRYSFE